MKHVVQFSGGKDSTCMLLMMLEKGMQVDEIIFCDTGKEFPGMYTHIQRVSDYIKPYGKKITMLTYKYTFDYLMFDIEKTKGKNIGEKGYNWARAWRRWCTAYLKIKPVADYLKKIEDGYKLYIGIAWDEPKRHELIKKNHVHPLFDWGITEKQALEYCYSKGFNWGGLYEDFDRVSCWCCPLQPIRSLRTLYKKYPDLWEQLKEMDNRCKFTFKPDCSVLDFEERFKREDWKASIEIDLFQK